MIKMVGIIHPFDVQQKLYVFEDGNQIYYETATIHNLINEILTIADTYSVEQVDLAGPKQYNRGLVKQLREAETAKYNNANKLKINVM